MIDTDQLNRQDVSHAKPGILMIIVDQSGSMEFPWPGLSANAPTSLPPLPAFIQPDTSEKDLYELIPWLIQCSRDPRWIESKLYPNHLRWLQNWLGVTVEDRPRQWNSKATIAALLVNECLRGVIQFCRKGTLRKRLYTIVLGYTTPPRQSSPAIIEPLFSGWAADLVSANERPFWIRPKAFANTPTAEAFEEAARLLTATIGENHNTFSKSKIGPLVIHITDGIPDDKKDAQGYFTPDRGGDRSSSAVEKLRDVKMPTGDPTKVFNASISDTPMPELLCPSQAALCASLSKQSGTAETPEEFLFKLSDLLPDVFIQHAKKRKIEKYGHLVEGESHGLLVNASIASILEFIQIGTATAGALG